MLIGLPDYIYVTSKAASHRKKKHLFTNVEVTAHHHSLNLSLIAGTYLGYLFLPTYLSIDPYVGIYILFSDLPKPSRWQNLKYRQPYNLFHATIGSA